MRREVLGGGRGRQSLERVAAADVSKQPWLEDQSATDEPRIVKGQLDGRDPTRAGAEHDHVIETQGLEEPRRIVRVLRGSSTGPVLATTAERPSAVVRHDREAGQAFGDRTPLLRVLAACVDHQHGRTGATNLRVQGRAVDVIPTDPWRVSVRQRERVHSKVRVGPVGTVRAA
jgi:hypothetical protein